MIEQKWFSQEEGNKVYRKLAEVLVEKYGAYALDNLETGSWESQVRVLVPDTDGKYSVVAKPTRISNSFDWFNTRWSQARIKVGIKRWFSLNLGDDGWIVNKSKLFDKIESEMAVLRAEYNQKKSVEGEMDEARRTLAHALSIDENSISMETPSVASLRLGWGRITIGCRIGPDKSQDLQVIGIHVSPRTAFNVDAAGVNEILDTLNSVLGENNEPR